MSKVFTSRPAQAAEPARTSTAAPSHWQARSFADHANIPAEQSYWNRGASGWSGPAWAIPQRQPASPLSVRFGVDRQQVLRQPTGSEHEETRIAAAKARFPDVFEKHGGIIEDFQEAFSKVQTFEKAQALVLDYGQTLWEAATAFAQNAHNTVPVEEAQPASAEAQPASAEARARGEAQPASAEARARGEGPPAPPKNATDDRPLYWSRLELSKIIRTKAPGFEIKEEQRRELLELLESSSRGMTTASFDVEKGVKRILISGFDPFGLESPIYYGLDQSNPSGAIALNFDGKTINGPQKDGKPVQGHIEAVIFPVRYQDFDAGVVEQFFRPYLVNSSVDMIMTISMGGSKFDLETWAGMRRSSGDFEDNAGQTTPGTEDEPLAPPFSDKEPTPEFVKSSLPMKEMSKVEGTDPVNENKSRVPKAGSKGPAVEGSGGGFLSNEISYRTLRLRDNLGKDIPVGHLHVPYMKGNNESKRQKIIAQTWDILKAALPAL